MAVADLEPQADDESGLAELTDAQFGSIAEERLATAVTIQAPGMASTAFPLVDLGFDFYLRRIRTLRVHPVQVKARSFLYADRLFEVNISSLHPDPRGYVVLPFVAPPDWVLSGQLWAIPIPEFLALAQPDGRGWRFSAHLDERAAEAATRFLIDAKQLQSRWISKIPGWKDPVRAAGLTGPVDVDEVPRAAARPFGKAGELWLASELMRMGLDKVSIAQDRLRLDCVDLLLHELESFAVLGLAVHTSTVETLGKRQIVEFRIRDRTFFTDPRLLVVVLVYRTDGSLHETAFLMPSTDIPGILSTTTDKGDVGYVGRFRIDDVPARFRPHEIPTARLGATILDRLFGR